jgi:hypothetical protein
MESQVRKCHWENVYETRPERGVSWFESVPALSLELIRKSVSDFKLAVSGGIDLKTTAALLHAPGAGPTKNLHSFCNEI